MQGLLTASRATVQAQPSGRAATEQDFSQRSALDVVAGRAVSIMPATLTVDATGQICTWSREAEELLGYSPSEAVGQSIEIIIPHHLRHRHRAGFGRFVQTGISTLPEITTTTAIHKTGKLMKLPISAKALYREDRRIIAVEATFYPSRDVA